MEQYKDFGWSAKIVIRDITKKIERGLYKVVPLELYSGMGWDSSDDSCLYTGDWDLFCDCIDNFVELGKVSDIYRGSLGTDGNPIISWKIQTQDGCWFYVIGKYNHVTLQEDIIIFYNEAKHYEAMKCRLIAGGSVAEEPFSSFWDLCRSYYVPS